MGQVSESSILASCTPKKPVVTMAETDEFKNEDSSPKSRMVGAKPTNPTAASDNPLPVTTTYKTQKIYDTGTCRTLEFVQYKDVKKLLEDTIAKEERMDNVKLDERFLREIDYDITSKVREHTVQLQLQSEQNTRYENFHGKTDMKYTFARSYEDSTSLAIITGKKTSVTIGGDIGAQHSWNKGEEKGKGHAEKKDLTINGVVTPGECVTVKEVVHNAIKTAVCDVVLKIPKNVKVPFTGRKKEKEERFNWWYTCTYPTTNKTTMKRLLTDEFRNNKCVRVWNGKVEFRVRNEFIIEATEHTLEVHTHESETKRVKRVKLAYENGCHKYANDIQKMAEITTVQTQAAGVVRTFLTSILEYIKERFTGTAE